MEKEMIPKRVTTVGYNGSTKRNVTPEVMLKDIKQDLWQKILDKEKKMIIMRTLPVSCKGFFKNKKMTLVTYYVLKLYHIDEMFTWHYPTFCHEKKRMYGIPQEGIHLWIEVSWETVVSKVYWNSKKVWVLKRLRTIALFN